MASEYIRQRFDCVICKNDYSRNLIISPNFKPLPDKEYICIDCYEKQLEYLDEQVQMIQANNSDLDAFEEYEAVLSNLKEWLC